MAKGWKIEIRRVVCSHKTSLTSPHFFFIEVLVEGQETERACISVLVISIFPLSVIVLLPLGNVRIKYYFWFFALSNY